MDAAASPATAAASSESPQVKMRKPNEHETAPTTTECADEGKDSNDTTMSNAEAPTADASPSSTSFHRSSSSLSSTPDTAPASASPTTARSDTTSSTQQPSTSASATHDPSSTSKLVTSPSDSPGPDPIQLRLIEDFLTAEECGQVIRIGESGGFEPSELGLATQPGYIGSIRTSFTSFAPQCDPIREVILQRLRERIFGRETVGTAKLVLVLYQAGQQFKQHDDSYLKEGSEMLQYTIFVSLNDVESGGETWLSLLDLKVRPQRGAALFWENHADRYTEVHDEAEHAGLPPTKGMKVSHICVCGSNRADDREYCC
jgi:hypothetical protein